MRKLSAISALLCLLFLTTGYQLVYQIRIAETRQEMRQQLLSVKSGTLTKLIFNPDEMKSLVWEETNEFRYKGEMYDVLRSEFKDGKTVFWCLSDKKETALLQQYQNSQKQSSGTSGYLLKLLTVQYLPGSLIAISTPERTRQHTFTFFQHYFPQRISETITPPPKIC